MIEQNQLGPVAAPPQLSPVAGNLPGGLAIFSETFEIYKKRLKVFLSITALPMVANFLIVLTGAAIFFLVVGPALLKMPKDSLNILTVLTASWPIIIVSAIALLIMISLQLWSQIALVVAVSDESRTIGAVESYRRAWPKILSYYWLGILSCVIVWGGFVLFFVPGLIMTIWFSFAAFILITENEKGFKALIKSHEYVRGHWWGVFWRFFVLAFLSMAIMLGALMAYFILILLFTLLTPLLSPFVSLASQMAISLFLTPLFAIYPFILYKHLRNRKGAFVCQPTQKQKIGFTLIGLVGIIVAVIIIVFTAQLFANSTIPTGPLIGPDRAQGRAHDARVKSAISQARTVMLFVYSNDQSYENLNCENPEMAPLCSTIKESSYQKQGLTIQSVNNLNNSSACLYAPLNKDDGQSWYCADSAGNSGTSEIDPSATCNEDLSEVACPAGLTF